MNNTFAVRGKNYFEVQPCNAFNALRQRIRFSHWFAQVLLQPRFFLCKNSFARTLNILFTNSDTDCGICHALVFINIKLH